MLLPTRAERFLEEANVQRRHACHEHCGPQPE